MANVLVEANLPHCKESRKLEELTGIERAWSLPFMLWSWAIQNDVQDGKLRLSLLQLMHILGRSNRSLNVIEPMVQSGFLTRGKDDDGDFLYMEGWERNASYFKKKNEDRAKKKAAREAEMSRRNRGDVAGDVAAKVGPPLTPTLSLTPSQEVVAGASTSSGPPPAEGKQRIRDPLTVRAFIEKFNQLVRSLGSGSPALQNGLDPYRASSIVERCRETGIKLEDITAAVLVDWFKPDTNRSTYTLEALDKAAPKLIEKVTRDWSLSRAEVTT